MSLFPLGFLSIPNPMMIPKSLSLPLALLLCTHPLVAQEAPPVRAEIRLLAFSTDIQQKDVFIQDPAALPETASTPGNIKTYLNHEFVPVVLKSRKISFTTKPDRASLTREGELVGEVTLPVGAESSILLFLPGKPGEKTLYRIMPIADSKKAFPAGSFNITNLSPMPMRLLLEKTNFEFTPGQTKLVENPPVRAGGVCGMRASVFRENRWDEISTSLWPHPGNARALMIMYLDTASGNVQLKGYDDVPPRAPKPDTANVP